MEKVITFEVIGQFLVDILVKAGIPREDAMIVADVLSQADKFGFDSHGVNRLKTIYLDRINQGILNPVTKIEIVQGRANYSGGGWTQRDGTCYRIPFDEACH